MTEATTEATEPTAPAVPETEPLPEIPEGPSAFESLGNEEGAEPTGETSQAVETEGLTADEVATLEKLLPKYNHKIKVLGEERELTFDELVKKAQIADGADEKFKLAAQKEREAAITQQNWQNFLHALETNPRAVLENPESLGIPKWKAREAAEAMLTDVLKRELMDPGERRALELEEENTRLKARFEEENAKSAAAQRTALERHYELEFDQKITAALENSTLPKDPHTVKRVAELMYSALEQGIDADASEVVEIVEEELTAESGKRLSGMTYEQLTQTVPKEILDILRKGDLAQLKSPRPGATAAPEATTTMEKIAATKDKSGTMSMDEWTARNKKLMERFA